MTEVLTADQINVVRRGFMDHARARKNFEAFGPMPSSLIDLIAGAASPDSALASLVRIAEQVGPAHLLQQLADRDCANRIVTVLGASEALGEFWARHPEYLSDVGQYWEANTRNEAFWRQWLGKASTGDELRILNNRALTAIAARDLTGSASFCDVSAELSDVAVATLDAALTIVSADEPRADEVRLAVVALGKTGGRELNYISDVDVIFVAESVGSLENHEALQIATRLASALIRLCGTHTAEGRIWEVDPNLRPEGKDGPLVRTLSSHLSYYERWASTWEFQALLKARHAAGDEELSRDYLAAVTPLVWNASTRDGFVKDSRAMRRRVIDNIPQEHRDRQLKLGQGGLRDVEFAVQMLQLVHGRADEALRSPTTLEALAALTDRGYVGRMDAAGLEEAYVFLRTLEHRIQVFRMQRTHIVPEAEEDLRRIGRSMGFAVNSAENLVRQWQLHRRVVSRIHEQLFYRPLLEAVAALPTEHLRLSHAAAEDRLAALGFLDPVGAMRHLEALTSGLSRRAAILRSLMPAMLAWFAESPAPDAGLLAFRRISEELGETHWYLRKLRDEGTGAEQLARLVSSSSYVTDLMVRAPDSVAMLGDDEELTPRAAGRLLTEMRMALRRHELPEGAVKFIRRIRRRELSRIAMADVLGRLTICESGEALSDLNIATLQASLDVVEAAWQKEHGVLPTRNAMIVMGRLGGNEAGYGSDADVMFVHDPVDGADAQTATQCAMWVAQSLRQLLSVSGDDPALLIDADLRPEGKNGPLVRTLAAYESYYARWSEIWEAQALLKARAVVGDADLCRRFTTLIDPIRYRHGGLTEAEVREIRRIKARVESERLPRGANVKTHLKLGRGGLADIEWTAQLLQLCHAGEHPELRTTGTIEALEMAHDLGLLDRDDRDILTSAWRFVSQIRDGVMLLRGRSAESMVEQASERAGLAHLLGWGQDGSEAMVNEYMRLTRQARHVVERVFYG